MARSVSDIKTEITAAFMNNENAAALYRFEPGSSFSDYFGAVSVENIFLYVWAVCAWTIEQLTGLHRREVNQLLTSLTPHRPKWYRDKVLAFMADTLLMPDSDEYDTSGMNQSEIDGRRIVKHAVAVESKDASLLIIKVAGETSGKREPIGSEHELQLKAYISEIKDAGVRVSLVNMEADTFNCTIDIYYNALLSPESVHAGCEDAILDYIENLPFNGEYTNMALIDRIQEVEGVEIAELKGCEAKAANENTVSAINARLTPVAGYFKAGEIKINLIPYDRQD